MGNTRKPGGGRKPSKSEYSAERNLAQQMEAAADLYTDKMSLQAIADALSLNPIKVRKLLITAGVYESDAAKLVRQTFNVFRKTQNYSTAVTSTMSALQLSRPSVTSYLPYEKGVYPVVYGLTDEDDWHNEANWYKANPSLGQTIRIERVRDAYREALDNPAEENVFKQLRLNMWVSSLTRFIPEHIYNLGSQPIDMEDLKGRDCYGGLDLSSTGDITALVLMFPPRTPEEKYIMLPFFWIPEDTIPQRVRRASVPYDIWHQQGYLMATEGNVIHYGFIEEFIKELGEKYHILEIAFDRWGAVQMTQNLEGMGFTVVPFGQGFKDMSPPTKEFYKLLMEGHIVHGGNPIMAWMAGNVVVDTDPAGNIKPTKAKSPEKIDGSTPSGVVPPDRILQEKNRR